MKSLFALFAIMLIAARLFSADIEFVATPNDSLFTAEALAVNPLATTEFRSSTGFEWPAFVCAALCTWGTVNMIRNGHSGGTLTATIVSGSFALILNSLDAAERARRSRDQMAVK